MTIALLVAAVALAVWWYLQWAPETGARRHSAGRRLAPGSAGELEAPARALPAGRASLATEDGRGQRPDTADEGSSGGRSRGRGGRRDVALRALRASSSRSGLPELDRVEVGDESVDVVLRGSRPAPEGFWQAGERRWRTTAMPERLAVLSRCSVSPAAAVVPVARTRQGADLFLDLEGSGVTLVEGPPGETVDVLRAVVLDAARIPWPEQPEIVLVGLDGELTEVAWVSRAGSLAAALERAERHGRRTRAALQMAGVGSLGEARARGAKGDRWTPLVVVSAWLPATPVEQRRIRDLALARDNGVAVVVPAPLSGVLPGRRLASAGDGMLLVDGVDEPVLPAAGEAAPAGAVLRVDEAAWEALPSRGPTTARALGPVAALAPARESVSESGSAVARASAPESPPAAPSQPDPVVAEPTHAAARHEQEAPAPPADPAPASVSAPLAATPARSARPAPPAAAPAATGDPRSVEAAAPVAGLADVLVEVEVLVRVLGHVEAVRLRPADRAEGGDRGELVEGADEVAGAVPTGLVEERLTPPRPKALEAVVYLALREGQVDRDALEIRLFPDGTNKPKTMYNVVTAARSMLGEALFPAPDDGRYMLSEAVATDYGLFSELVARAEDSGDPTEAISLLTGALALVRGEPFMGPGRSYGWAGPHRSTIEAHVADAAEELAEIHLVLGNWRSAEWAARRGLRAFPHDERMYRLLMRAAGAAGNVGAVKRVFAELSGVLAEPGETLDPATALHPETLELVAELTGSPVSQI